MHCPSATEEAPLQTAAREQATRRLPADFAALYEEHSRGIYYIALRLLGDPSLAEDATHDIFLKVFQKIDKFRGESAIRTWLYRITLNHCQNILKSWYHRKISTAE